MTNPYLQDGESETELLMHRAWAEGFRAGQVASPEYSAQTVIQQFKDWTQGGYLMRPYAVLDTETTDLDGEIIELAIVDMQGRVLFNERMKPKGLISPGAHQVHGIRDADLAGLPGMAYWWPKIRRLISRHHILVYNKDFDFKALSNSLDGALPEWFKGVEGASDPYSADYWVMEMARKRAQCVMEAYSPLAGWWNDWHGSYRWAKLIDACRQRGIDLSDLKAHSALGDAMATLRLIQACANLAPAQFPWIGQEGEE